MPTYTFFNNSTEEEWTEIMTIAQKEDFLINNSNISQKIVCEKNGGGIISGTGVKADEGFRDILREMKRVNPGNTIDVI